MKTSSEKCFQSELLWNKGVLETLVKVRENLAFPKINSFTQGLMMKFDNFSISSFFNGPFLFGTTCSSQF